MLVVKDVEKNSIGEEMGFEVGDIITHFNGHKIVDILDYLYYDSLTSFTMKVSSILLSISGLIFTL